MLPVTETDNTYRTLRELGVFLPRRDGPGKGENRFRHPIRVGSHRDLLNQASRECPLTGGCSRCGARGEFPNLASQRAWFKTHACLNVSVS